MMMFWIGRSAFSINVKYVFDFMVNGVGVL
jgi:hypothetical protein